MPLSSLRPSPARADHDLRPPGDADQHYGEIPIDRVAHERTAADVNNLYPRLSQLTRDQLRSIPLLDAGTRLQEGKTYLDVRQLDKGEFFAGVGQVVRPGDEIVAKHQVDYQMWDSLSGQAEPSRT
jgi:hypothetical protein